MRVAVVVFPEKDRNALIETGRFLARGIEAQGYEVDFINACRDNEARLTVYGYIVIGAESRSWLSRHVPEGIPPYLSHAGMIGGKKCFAFIQKRGFGNGRALLSLMKIMEAEGMFIRFSEVITGPEEAEAIGKRLHIEDY
jgi:hypothetical protein